MLYLHPNSTHACWLPEEQQLSTLVRVARLQRTTTLQASSYGEMSGHQSCKSYVLEKKKHFQFQYNIPPKSVIKPYSFN